MHRSVALSVLAFASAAAIGAPRLAPRTAAAWDVYVLATERRIARELQSPDRFFALDFDADASPARRALLSGELVVEAMAPSVMDGRTVSVPAARVEHWRGAVLIRGITAGQLLDALEVGPPPSDDVLRSEVLDRGPGWMRVSMTLRRTAILTVTYDTEHLVTFARESPSRATSTSTATRIVELSNDDHGFLWRLNAYWRYQSVPGGVIAECESISLSRDVPAVVRLFVNPLVEHTARESMSRTLDALRTRFSR